MTFKYSFFSLLLLFQLKYCAKQQATYLPLLEAELELIVEEHELPGISFSLYSGADVETLVAGYDDIEQASVMTVNHRMPAGSVGKIFVSAVALKQIESGALALKDKISKYLGDESWFEELPNKDDITIRNLLNHTSGMPRYIFQEKFLKAIKSDPLLHLTPRECIAFVLGLDPVHPAGNGFAYSDTNYILLGVILEKITGRSYVDLQQSLTIDSYKLEKTEAATKRSYKHLAQGYIGPMNFFGLPKKVVQDGQMAINPAFEWTGGGLVSHSADLAVFLWELHSGRFFGVETYKELTTLVDMRTGAPSNQGYGLGTFAWRNKGQISYGHQGFFPGYITHVEYFPDIDFAFAIQINTDAHADKLSSISRRLKGVLMASE